MGLAAAPTRRVLDSLHAEGKQRRPCRCPVFRSFVQQHPEYAARSWRTGAGGTEMLMSRRDMNSFGPVLENVSSATPGSTPTRPASGAFGGQDGGRIRILG